MATIADLHKSISEIPEKDIFNLIRHLRELRREIPIRPAKKETKKKNNSRQITIDEHINKMRSDNRDELLKKLLEIRKGR